MSYNLGLEGEVPEVRIEKNHRLNNINLTNLSVRITVNTGEKRAQTGRKCLQHINNL